MEITKELGSGESTKGQLQALQCSWGFSLHTNILSVVCSSDLPKAHSLEALDCIVF